MIRSPSHLSSRRYRIERYLTEGGMGAIYVGKKVGPRGFEKEVVLKQLLPEYTSRPEFRDLFYREAKISATLDHANIVHTFDLVESDQSLFIVMEYVRGADLRTIGRRARIRRGELGAAAAIHIALEILNGLSYAHGKAAEDGSPLEIIHRDLSPSNILCSWQGEVKLSDFGIAKVATQSSVFYRVRGKVGYMAPEQAKNETIDERCDLYSLAVCLYESLIGERLFVGDLNTPPEEIYSQPILPLSHKNPKLPRAFDLILKKALEFDAALRYQNAAAFADALHAVAHKSGLLMTPPELGRHLHEILGPNPDRWLYEDTAQPEPPDTQKLSLGGGRIEGKELEAVGAGFSDVEAKAVEKSDVITLTSDDSGLEEVTTHDGEPVREPLTATATMPAVRPEAPLVVDDSGHDLTRSLRGPGLSPPPAPEHTPTDLFKIQHGGPAPTPVATFERKRRGAHMSGTIKVQDDDDEPTVARDLLAGNDDPTVVSGRPPGPPPGRPGAPAPTLFGRPGPVFGGAAAGRSGGPPLGLRGVTEVPPQKRTILGGYGPPAGRPYEPALTPAGITDPLPTPPAEPTALSAPATFSFESGTPEIDGSTASLRRRSRAAVTRVVAATAPPWVAVIVLVAASLVGAGFAHVVTSTAPPAPLTPSSR